MIIKCDYTVTQLGIFTDSLHFDDVSTQCNSERDSQATMFILNTHGSNKYECLYQSKSGIIKGSHYVPQYWGTIEYRLITRTECGIPTSVNFFSGGLVGLEGVGGSYSDIPDVLFLRFNPSQNLFHNFFLSKFSTLNTLGYVFVLITDIL